MANELDEVLKPLKYEITKALPPSMQTARNQEWLAQLPPDNVIDLVRTHPKLIHNPQLQEKANELEKIAFHFYGDVHLTVHNHYHTQPTGNYIPPSHPYYDPYSQLPSHPNQHPSTTPFNINFSPSINVEGSKATSKSSQDNSSNAPLGLAVLFVLAFLLVIAVSN